MATHTASCGHEVTLEWMFNGGAIWIKDYARDCSRAACYITVCPECLKWYDAKRLILKTERAKHRWLFGVKRKRIGRNK